MGLLKKVVFLDRDGTINQDSADYVKSRAEFELLPGSIEALKKLTDHGFTSIVITNQSALARKLTTLEELNAMHDMLGRAIAARGGEIADFFFCSHLPNEGCGCRKPAPGLIQQACRKYDIDLADSIMVGDSAKDIACGRNAGCGRTVLVESGLNPCVAKELKEASITADHVADDLRAAAAWIIAEKG